MSTAHIYPKKKIGISTISSKHSKLKRCELIQSLQKEGYAVSYLFQDQNGELHSDYHLLNVSYVPLPRKRYNTNPISEAKSLFQIKNILKDANFDSLILYSLRTFPTMVLAGRMAGVKKILCIVNGTGRLFQGNGLMGFILYILAYPLLFLSLNLADFIFFQNPDDLEMIKGRHLLWKQNYGLINGSGVNLETFHVVPLEGRPVFTMICRVMGHKGVNEFIIAARRVKAVFPDAIFQLIGRMDDLDQSINEHEFNTAVQEEIVQYIGRVDDVRPYLAKSRFFVLPSYYREGVPRTNLEAMAMGRPIITTDWPGCRETVVDGVNGFLVPIRDANALAEKMIYLIEHPDDAARMGRESRRIAEEKFDIYKINEKIIQKLMS